jgi:hypothetical protein
MCVVIRARAAREAAVAARNPAAERREGVEETSVEER